MSKHYDIHGFPLPANVIRTPCGHTYAVCFGRRCQRQRFGTFPTVQRAKAMAAKIGALLTPQKEEQNG